MARGHCLPHNIAEALEQLLRDTYAPDYDCWEALEEELLDEFSEDEQESWGCEIGSRIEEWWKDEMADE